MHEYSSGPPPLGTPSLKGILFGICLIVVITLATVMTLEYLDAVHPLKPTKNLVPTHIQGDVVQSVVNGDKGQVIYTICDTVKCGYEVRFKTDTGRYQSIMMNGFEIEKVTQ